MKDQKKDLPVLSFQKGLGLEKAKEWSLVLCAMNIPHRIYHGSLGWIFKIEEKYQRRAEIQINLYEKENAPRPEEKDQHASGDEYFIHFPYFVAFLLFCFHSLVYAFTDPHSWLDQGSASAALILNGQWWRTVTALTLHADSGHILSNIVIGGLILASLRSRLGNGLTWVLVLLSGVSGNYLNAVFYKAEHLAIGASTAVFGSLGILTGLSFFDKIKRRSWKSWLPVISAFAFLTLFGLGYGVDFTAHLFGLLSGFILSLLAFLSIQQDKIPKKIMQRILSVLSLWFVIVSWLVAFKSL